MAGDLAKQEGLGSEIDKDEQLIPLTVPLATEIPVIDLRRLLAASTDADLSDLRSALSSWGCFQVVNHGIESSLLAEVCRITREFFELPMRSTKATEPTNPSPTTNFPTAPTTYASVSSPKIAETPYIGLKIPILSAIYYIIIIH